MIQTRASETIRRLDFYQKVETRNLQEKFVKIINFEKVDARVHLRADNLSGIRFLTTKFECSLVKNC
jgi:hypothetical protein